MQTQFNVSMEDGLVLVRIPGTIMWHFIDRLADLQIEARYCLRAGVLTIYFATLDRPAAQTTMDHLASILAAPAPPPESAQSNTWISQYL
jgi:hypothetical protein